MDARLRHSATPAVLPADYAAFPSNLVVPRTQREGGCREGLSEAEGKVLHAELLLQGEDKLSALSEPRFPRGWGTDRTRVCSLGLS